jgi:hypothetical protein
MAANIIFDAMNVIGSTKISVRLSALIVIVDRGVELSEI